MKNKHVSKQSILEKLDGREVSYKHKKGILNLKVIVDFSLHHYELVLISDGNEYILDSFKYGDTVDAFDVEGYLNLIKRGIELYLEYGNAVDFESYLNKIIGDIF